MYVFSSGKGSQWAINNFKLCEGRQCPWFSEQRPSLMTSCWMNEWTISESISKCPATLQKTGQSPAWGFHCICLFCFWQHILHILAGFLWENWECVCVWCKLLSVLIKLCAFFAGDCVLKDSDLMWGGLLDVYGVDCRVPLVQREDL